MPVYLCVRAHVSICARVGSSRAHTDEGEAGEGGDGRHTVDTVRFSPSLGLSHDHKSPSL